MNAFEEHTYITITLGIVARFPSRFVKRLNETPWIPIEDGDLKLPGSVSFAELGWAGDDFLLSQIEFMQPRFPFSH